MTRLLSLTLFEENECPLVLHIYMQTATYMLIRRES